MSKFNFDYDEESDDLFLFSEHKSKGSIEIGDLVLDFDSKGNVVGIEFLNATRFISESGSRVSKEFLRNLEACDVKVSQKNNFLFIKLTLATKTKEVIVPINAPFVLQQSPALAC